MVFQAVLMPKRIKMKILEVLGSLIMNSTSMNPHIIEPILSIIKIHYIMEVLELQTS
jgi:hypothetical protein